MKNSINDLALLGGSPEFSQPLYVGKPNIGDKERFLSRMNDILETRLLTNNGPFVREFEERVARMMGVKHCVAMANATVALEIVTRALGMEGEVIVPSMTFVATAHALQWQQITPLFADVTEGGHHIDPEQVERLITPRTTGIIGVHLWGQACDVHGLSEIARRHKLKLVFDAAHAFGCSYNGRTIGSFGDAEVLSFHATKFVNSFEGGAILTNNDELAEQTRLMRNFGFTGRDQVIHVGTNGKMSEASAAMGLTSLESIDEFVDINRHNYLLYRELLTGIPGLKLTEYDEHERNNYQYIVIEIDQQVTGIDRDLLQRILHGENVQARRYFYPGCHRMEPYRSYFPHAGLLLPRTEALLERVLTLPTGSSVSEDDVRRICALLALAINHGSILQAKLG